MICARAHSASAELAYHMVPALQNRVSREDEITVQFSGGLIKSHFFLDQILVKAS